jgi:flagellar hook-associated protein FlgK
LIAFQRAYQADAKMVTVLDSLTETLMNILPDTGS